MKINSLTIQGFRGFNEEKTIDLHDKLTLIYAQNSYGKTSISEALEWLLYGITSKVEKADSKDEYKGSYRNRHLPELMTPFVRARFAEGGKSQVFTGELTSDDSLRRFVGEPDAQIEVENWPISQDLRRIPQPFILQHALKYLLLVKPDDRFQGFARLLGLEDLDEIHRNIISLCTAPERKIPPEVNELLKRAAALESRLTNRPTLSSIQKAFKKKGATPREIYSAVSVESKRRVPEGTADESLLPQLLKIREDAVGKVFKGHLTLSTYPTSEAQNISDDEQFLLGFLTEVFIQEYMQLVALLSVERVLKQAQFYEIGVGFLGEIPSKCPLCGQIIDEELAQHINSEHKRLHEQSAANNNLKNQRKKVTERLGKLRERLDAYHSRHSVKAKALLNVKPQMEQLRTILMPKHEVHVQRVESAVSDVASALQKIEVSFKKTISALGKVTDSVESSTEDVALIGTFSDCLLQYIADARSYGSVISEKAPAVMEADRILQRELDAIAGTEDVSLLIDVIEQRPSVEKKFEIDRIIDSLKELRRTADQFVAKRMLDAISNELTTEVMEWYKQIRTAGDPDVHFDGFDMERTQKGEIKARRVSIKAKSYGQDLVSAVSSLSESKLNALGLCVSIATNLKGQSPFEFLIIDDPIQSLDAEHETQFVQVIRSLVVERGKQVIVLSHNRKWLEQVRVGCSTLDGWFYEVTGYTKSGPHISPVSWARFEDRLSTVDAIVKDPDSNSIRLQQAEQEIRIVVADLTCKLYAKKKKVDKSPHSLNSAQVKKMLAECGVESNLTDRIVQTFSTTDDSHHAPNTYSPDRERIRRYHAWAHELANLLK